MGMGLLEKTIETIETISGGDIAPAIILGSGIHKTAFEYCQQSDLEKDFAPFCSWPALLDQIDASPRFEGISALESFTLQRLRERNSNGVNRLELKWSVVEKLGRMKRPANFDYSFVSEDAKDTYYNFVQLAKENDCPVLTTNFDLMLEKFGCHAEMKRKSKCPPDKSRDFKLFPQDRPWCMHSALTGKANERLDFSIWHIHGDVSNVRSIQLGLDDYARSITAAANGLKKSIHWDQRLDWTSEVSFIAESWMDCFLNRPLIIVGLGLDKQEIFLRWLLLERKRLFDSNLKGVKSDVYLLVKKEEECKDAADFVRALDGEVKESNEYAELYC